MKCMAALSVVIICIAGCRSEPNLMELISTSQVLHKSGVAYPELHGAKLLDLGKEFSLAYPANKEGRAELVVSIYPLGKEGTGNLGLNAYEARDATTWIKESEYKPGFEKRRKMVDVVRKINEEYWIRVEVMTTVDLVSARDFSLMFVDRIRYMEQAE